VSSSALGKIGCLHASSAGVVGLPAAAALLSPALTASPLAFLRNSRRLIIISS
jgi:hypothetical protein